MKEMGKIADSRHGDRTLCRPRERVRDRSFTVSQSKKHHEASGKPFDQGNWVVPMTFLLLWQNIWEKQLTEGGGYFGSQLEDTVHHDGESKRGEAQGNWSSCVQLRSTERGGGCPPAPGLIFSLFSILSGTQVHRMSPPMFRADLPSSQTLPGWL